MYKNTGKFKKAATDYNTALKINPNYSEAYIGRGEVYDRANQAKQALRDYNRAIALGTTNPRAYHRRGIILQRQRGPCCGN